MRHSMEQGRAGLKDSLPPPTPSWEQLHLWPWHFIVWGCGRRVTHPEIILPRFLHASTFLVLLHTLHSDPWQWLWAPFATQLKRKTARWLFKVHCWLVTALSVCTPNSIKHLNYLKSNLACVLPCRNEGFPEQSKSRALKNFQVGFESVNVFSSKFHQRSIHRNRK